MKTDILTPKALFQKDIQYTIPPFQRRYVWTQEEQWEPLWEDVRNAADDYLEKLEQAGGRSVDAEQSATRHFLGAVVVQQVNTATRDLDRREVIDGQQRLTTLQLLLDAVQFVCEQREIKGVATRLSKLVLNDEDLVDNSEDRFKLWPTTGDREAFRHAMSNGLATENYERSLIVQAHEYFQLQTNQWLESNTESLRVRAEALETAITGLLQTVTIDLGTDDDPHIIFETLNARGTPLLESDLIKNYVISETRNEELWKGLDDNWWREDFRQGRLLRPRIDALLDYWLEMRTCHDVSVGSVFRTFKQVAANGGLEEMMLGIKRDLTRYRQYEEGPRTPIEDVFHYRAGVMQMGAFTPALLRILTKPDAARFGALQTLESFLVRRMVCRNTTKDYNRLAHELVRQLDRFEAEKADRAVIQFFDSQTADSRRWPSDNELDHALITLPLYKLLTRGRLRLILEATEELYRKSSHAEQIEVPRNLTIEHVLPQSWEAHWPLPGNVDEHEERQTRNQLIHTIGNLTLVNGRLNSTTSNAPWERKRKTIEAHSVLLLNHHLIASHGEAPWNEREISDRGRRLAVLIARIWPRSQPAVSKVG